MDINMCSKVKSYVNFKNTCWISLNNQILTSLKKNKLQILRFVFEMLMIFLT